MLVVGALLLDQEAGEFRLRVHCVGGHQLPLRSNGSSKWRASGISLVFSPTARPQRDRCPVRHHQVPTGWKWRGAEQSSRGTTAAIVASTGGAGRLPEGALVMRKAGLIAAAAAIVLAGCNTVPDQAQHPLAAGQTSQAARQSLPAILHVHMVSASVGWALTGGAVLHTVDGGRTWTNVTPTSLLKTAHFVNVANQPWDRQAAFLNTNTAWVVQFPTTAAVVVYRTTDAGRSWSASSIKTTNQGGYLDMLNSKVDWLLTYGGAAAGSEGADLWATSDGGGTWRKAAAADPVPHAASVGDLPFLGDKHGVLFTSAADGWVGVSDPKLGQATVYWTHSAGQRWGMAHPPVPSDYASCNAFTGTPAGGWMVLPVTLECGMPGPVIYSGPTKLDRQSGGP